MTPPSSTISHIKTSSSTQKKHQLLKKRHLYRGVVKKKKVSTQVSMLPPSSPVLPYSGTFIRDRWMEIAKETQSIVLGDGQYVEERRVPIVPCALAQRIEGFSANPLGQVDSSTTVAVTHNISEQIQQSRLGTTFYPHQSEVLAEWRTPPAQIPRPLHKPRREFTHQSTLVAARRLAHHAPPTSPNVGVLSFASRKKPGGNFLHGSDEQEDRIARYSSLVASLDCPQAKEFYDEHRHFWSQDGSGFIDHSMVYSPSVVVFREDGDNRTSLGGSFIPPYLIDVLSVVPVNVAVVRARYSSASEKEADEAVRQTMKERMARALRVFEERGNRTVVLGAFGCTSSENKLDVVASIWAELLVCGDMEGEGRSKRPARFKKSFDNVVFAVPGKSFSAFKEAFDNRLFEAQIVDGMLSD
ncbi:hypothetical protein EIP91_001274 [Steccherinum ochraceum]|uniref:Microbial-type PARG catalytic domain-containing protein n=1 Tax=Steccherinum ochraceum TaxID=92696 RepID=A0A4R0RID6_9APHY|nr:hypothetical protein EIP91_001274 [Steccherinum ochraceum]